MHVAGLSWFVTLSVLPLCRKPCAANCLPTVAPQLVKLYKAELNGTPSALLVICGFHSSVMLRDAGGLPPEKVIASKGSRRKYTWIDPAVRSLRCAGALSAFRIQFCVYRTPPRTALWS